MKRIIFLGFFFLVFSSANAQQVEEFSLLRENAFILNPGVAGTQGYVHGVATFRKQFTRIQQSPYTAMLAFDGEIKDKHLGLGGYLIHDVTGPTGKSAATFAVSYNLPIFKKYAARYSNGSSDHVLCIGASLSVVQYRLQADKLILDNLGDPQLYTSRGSRIFPDASFGLYYKWKDVFYAGISIPQIMGLNINYQGNDGTAAIKTVQHINVLVGGKYEWAKGNFSINPVAAFRWVKGAPPQGDAGLRFMMYKIFWVGANYRSLNYAVFEAGFNVKEVFKLAYAYDFNFSKYRRDIGSTHEISLSFSIPKKNSVRKRNRRTLRF